MIYSRLETIRMQKKLTQSEFATAIGRSRQWYRDVRKTQNMKLNDLIEIAKSLGVHPSYFFASDYPTNDKTSLISEPHILKIEEMNELISTQKKLIERLEKEVNRLEAELSFYHEPGKSKEVI